MIIIPHHNSQMITHFLRDITDIPDNRVHKLAVLTGVLSRYDHPDWGVYSFIITITIICDTSIITDIILTPTKDFLKHIKVLVF